jgi:long-chain acyl-CoA synthetase
MKLAESNLGGDRGVFPLSELAERSAREFGGRPVMRTFTGSGYREITYHQFRDMVIAIAHWLVTSGIKQGDRVAVLGENSPQWGAVYLGIQTAGAIAVPVDSLLKPAGLRHVIADSESRFLFASDKFLGDLAEVASIPTLEKTIAIGSGGPGADTTLGAVLNEGARVTAELPKRDLDDIAAILYTSGTTGHSKGVMLTQNNIMSNVAAASQVIKVYPEDTFLSVLPIHHSFECTTGFLLSLYNGSSITYARSMKSADLMADIRETNVTLMVAVPLLYEKMQAGILRGVKKKGGLTQRLFSYMFGLSAVSQKIGFNLGTPLFAGMRRRAGLGTIRIFVSGGGALNPSTARFFSRLGICLIQGYGLTETSPVTHVNPPWKRRCETVGLAIPGVECKLIDVNEQGVGEICIRGPNVFKGYYRNEEATREVLEEDGWFHTGDLGAILSDGCLQICGRKKNMLVTGGGKNVYPEEVELYLDRSRFIAESLVLGVPREGGYGDDVAALIFPDYEQIDLYYEELGKKPTDRDVFELIKKEVAEAQTELQEYKRIRNFRIVEEEFQKTSTRKIKRFLYSGEMLKVNGRGEAGVGE